jgi:hypothetical protein
MDTVMELLRVHHSPPTNDPQGWEARLAANARIKKEMSR